MYLARSMHAVTEEIVEAMYLLQIAKTDRRKALGCRFVQFESRHSLCSILVWGKLVLFKPILIMSALFCSCFGLFPGMCLT